MLGRVVKQSLLTMMYRFRFLFIFAFLLFFSLNRHSKAGVFNYHSEIWADKAGYNVYLPALFIYNFEAKNFPDSVDFKTGEGFLLNKNTNKVITKYPYGVALLQSPFWLVAHFLAKEKTGFSKAYHKAIDVAAVFYFTLGIFFLDKTLLLRRQKSSKSNRVGWWAMILSILGTSVFYYGVYETGMSHIYSFAVFTAILFFLQKEKIGVTLLILSILALIIRPINVIFLVPILILFNNDDFEKIKQRLSNIFTVKNIILVSFLLFFIFLPQILYNQYAFGSFFVNSYQNEGFIFLTNPKISEVLFAPNNGLFLYNPLLLLIFGFLFFKGRKIENGLPLLVLLLYTILYSTWWSYNLGCGFGHRAFVDIMPIFVVSFAGFLEEKKSKIYLIIAVFCMIFTMKLMLSFDTCFFRVNDWDWNGFLELLKGKIK